MRMRAKKRARAKKPAYAQYAARIKRSMRAVSTRTMFAGVFGILGLAVVIGAATSRPTYEDAAAPHAATKASAPASAANAAANSSSDELPPVGVAAASPVATSGTRSGPVTTITGCLAREDAAYKLKDTAGDDAPRSRSWKTGFLKKGTAPVELYDSANRVKLPAHVGQRISVTGELIDREMYVRSLQRVSASCASKL